MQKKSVDKLVDECTETIEEVKLAKITLAENENSHKCSSCTVYTVVFWVFFTIFTGITIYFVYCNWSFIKNSVIFKTTDLISKILMQTCHKLTKKRLQRDWPLLHRLWDC